MATPRAVRVLPDVPAIDKTFDYLVPETFGDQVRVGTMVRIDLHGRRVGAWVVDDHVSPPPGVDLKPIAKVTGWGPPADVVDLCRWAAWRWAGRWAQLLRSASPDRAVRAVGRPRVGSAAATSHHEAVDRALRAPSAVLRWPPGLDGSQIVVAAASRGPVLVLHPSVGVSAQIVGLLARAGAPATAYEDRLGWAAAAAGGTSVVGARRAVFAPMPDLAAIVVLDAHDERYQEERTPAWNAVDVAVERATRAGVPCVLVSPCPSLETAAGRILVTLPRGEERSGWPRVEAVDRRGDDPRRGLFSDRVVHELRQGGRVLCVLNRTGRARLLACSACGELARCTECESAVAQVESELRCSRCGAARPVVCVACGGQRLKVLRPGVARVRDELEALVGEPVAEVTADTDGRPATRVVVGTEAVLHRVHAADAIVFLDFDQELLAPRYRAAEDAFALVARAARRAGRVLLQTRMPDHPAVVAATHADPDRLAADERPRRQALRFPPFAALAAVSGAGADEFVSNLRAVRSDEIEILGPSDRGYLLRAPDHAVLADALAAVARPAARTRVEVDPRRI